jgi:hypothetical protein
MLGYSEFHDHRRHRLLDRSEPTADRLKLGPVNVNPDYRSLS